MSSFAPERANAGDLSGIERLLKDSGLPIDGLRDHSGSLFVLKDGQTLVGSIGLEVYGETGLLRSLAVAESHRGQGLGNKLYEHLLAESRFLGIRRLILLTTTAESVFSRRGFKVIDRSSLSGGILNSAEFKGACPATALCMELSL